MHSSIVPVHEMLSGLPQYLDGELLLDEAEVEALCRPLNCCPSKCMCHFFGESLADASCHTIRGIAIVHGLGPNSSPWGSRVALLKATTQRSHDRQKVTRKSRWVTLQNSAFSGLSTRNSTTLNYRLRSRALL
jgi:hypothetical protein